LNFRIICLSILSMTHAALGLDTEPFARIRDRARECIFAQLDTAPAISRLA
jgi:hypothetical protein